MFEVYKLSETELLVFALLLVRISACLVTMPIFGNKDIPSTVKILLSLLITFSLFSSLKVRGVWPQALATENLIFFVMREAFIGVFIGFLCRGIFWAVQIAGQILGFSIGFSAAQAFNPALGDTGTMIEQFQSILAVLLFLIIDGHHWLLQAIVQSLEVVPLAAMSFKSQSVLGLGAFLQAMFEVGIKLSAPMVAVIMFVNGAMGVVGRAVPQVNVFVTSFPVNIMVGLSVFMVSIPLLLATMEQDLGRLTGMIFKFLKTF